MNYIRDGLALALQHIIAAAGYILPTAKLDTEKSHILECNPCANPLNLSFDIDPDPPPESPTTSEYSCVGGDITTTSHVQSLPPPPENIIGTVTATTHAHLHDKERLGLRIPSQAQLLKETRQLVS